MVAVWDFISFWQFDIIFAQCLIIMYLLNRFCQYEAYKDDKSNFNFKRMLFANFTQAFGRGICHLLLWLFFLNMLSILCFATVVLIG